MNLSYPPTAYEYARFATARTKREREAAWKAYQKRILKLKERKP